MGSGYAYWKSALKGKSVLPLILEVSRPFFRLSIDSNHLMQGLVKVCRKQPAGFLFVAKKYAGLGLNGPPGCNSWTGPPPLPRGPGIGLAPDQRNHAWLNIDKLSGLITFIGTGFATPGRIRYHFCVSVTAMAERNGYTWNIRLYKT